MWYCGRLFVEIKSKFCGFCQQLKVHGKKVFVPPRKKIKIRSRNNENLVKKVILRGFCCAILGLIISKKIRKKIIRKHQRDCSSEDWNYTTLRTMDMFHINDSSGISSTILDSDSPVTDITEVKFEAHTEFDLNFFDTPDDSMTQAAFSNPNSVESSASPEPTIVIQQHQKTNMASNQPAMLLNIKNGKRVGRISEEGVSVSWFKNILKNLQLNRISRIWNR